MLMTFIKSDAPSHTFSSRNNYERLLVHQLGAWYGLRTESPHKACTEVLLRKSEGYALTRTPVGELITCVHEFQRNADRARAAALRSQRDAVLQGFISARTSLPGAGPGPGPAGNAHAGSDMQAMLAEQLSRMSLAGPGPVAPPSFAQARLHSMASAPMSLGAMLPAQQNVNFGALAYHGHGFTVPPHLPMMIPGLPGTPPYPAQMPTDWIADSYTVARQ